MSKEMKPDFGAEATCPDGAIPDSIFIEFVRKHKLAMESLTERQLAEAIRQAIAAGDFERQVCVCGGQTVAYIPWREVDRLRSAYHELIFAVVSKHEGETRHETALRHIREAEGKTQGNTPPDEAASAGLSK